MPRLRLPVEFAMFSAGAGLLLLFFGVGMGAYILLPGGAAFPWWCVELGGFGLFLFLATASVYFLRIIQFVRQRGVEYDSFFWNLPIESPEHPKDAGDLFDDALSFLTTRWPHLAVGLVVALPLLKVLAKTGSAHSLLRADLGPIHNGGTHWDVGDVITIGGGGILVVFIVAMMIRRIWAMQRSDPPSR